MISAMLRTGLGALAVAGVMAAGAAAANAQTVKVLVVQEDWDKQSLARNNRIQRAVINTFNNTLNAPSYRDALRRYGISGMDVYDETAVTLRFYEQDRVRRRDEELIALSRQIRNPKIDVLVLYTLYARAVQDPYTRIRKLLLSMSYRALDVRSGRFFGGDNIDIDSDGIPLTGCATSATGAEADAFCVKEFVAEQGERLARDAGNELALRLAATLGQKYGGASYDQGYVDDNAKIGDADGYKDDTPIVASRGKGCVNIPTLFVVDYRGFSQKQLSFVESSMTQWRCALDLDSIDSSLSNARYEYKTRANQGMSVRNIRLMLELIGVTADVRTDNRNTIIVRAIGLRDS